ncbi:MAG: GNAT family N-acetyltransferase [Erysipelotrichaceae bacterium]|nr:GNAT family N-acetyltransferase [Erysipelotrichaceae bacterium]
MREISTKEVDKLKHCLEELADHHNMVSVNFKGHYPKRPFDETIRIFSDDLEEGKSSIAVIEEDEKVAGFCKIDFDDVVGILEYLVVLAEYRGKGYGTELMEWALNRFEEKGVHDIDVKVADGNKVISLYERFGFKMNAHILRLSR